MRKADTVRMEVTLPVALMENIQKRVASGEFSSVNEAIVSLLHKAEQLRELLPPLRKEDEEEWLQSEVLPTLERLQTGQEKTYSIEEVRRHFAARRARLSA